MDYEIGLIFKDDEDYSNKARWCNENDCYIEEIEPLDGVRQFQIKAVEHKAPTPEEHIAQITNAVQTHLDSAVQALNYDNGFACASYVNSTNEKFKKEALSYIAWRDAVWVKCYQLLEEYETGEIAMPTPEEVIAMLPEFKVDYDK